MDKDSSNKSAGSKENGTEAESLWLLDQFCAGEDTAATAIYERYVARLISLARSRLSQGLNRRVDPEDIVHSAYRSFFVRASSNDFELRCSGDLWRLLAQITINKVRKQVERHRAKRRDYRREERSDFPSNQVAIESSPEAVTCLEEQVQRVVERLSATGKRALTALIQGDSIDEIAEQLSKSPRTIRRAVARARTIAERDLVDTQSWRVGAEQVAPLLSKPLPYCDFRLERLIGAGATGKVYRATQHSTGASFAVKALRKNLQTDRLAVLQFILEAELIADLAHPGIIRIHGMGRFPAGGFFIVMDWIEGADLQAILEERQLTTAEVLRVSIAVTAAIVRSHRAGIVHCDLKPANVLIALDGRIVVTDFGFAQMIKGNEIPWVVGGTLGYFAPELLLAGEHPTQASDVYSLGKLFERIGLANTGPRVQLVEKCLATAPGCRPKAVEVLSHLRQMTSGHAIY